MSACEVMTGIAGDPPPPVVRGARRAAAVLMDLENLLNDVRPVGRAAVTRRLEQVWGLVESVADTRWKVGAGNRALVRYLVGEAGLRGLKLAPVPSGRNRADRALVDLATTQLPSSIDEVVLCSGDGDFIPLVWEQQSRGLFVTVIAPAQALSHHLARIADDVLTFPSQRPSQRPALRVAGPRRSVRRHVPVAGGRTTAKPIPIRF